MKKWLCIVFAMLTIFIVNGCGVGNGSLEDISKTLSTYTMDITFDEESKTLDVNQKLEYRNLEDVVLDELYFHLYPKSFNLDAEHKPVGVLTKAKAYYNGDSEGDIIIDSVKADKDVLSMTYINNDEDFLKIELKEDLHPDEKIIIEFDYTVVIPNCNHRFGYGENAINLGNFYPIMAVYENGEYSLNSYHSNGDPFYSDVANYIVTIVAPEKYVIASTGSLETQNTIDGVTTSKYVAKVVRDYAFVMSEKFQVSEANIEGVNVMYYYYNDENADKSLQASVDSVVTFSESFGKYPYSTLSVVQTNFVHGGMEYPNLVYISDEVTGADYINVIVHEIAHQWWYGVVGNDEYINSWLDEGLTEFSTNLFYEKNPSYGVDAEEVVKNITKSYITFVDVYSSVLGKVDTTMNRKLDEYDTEPEYVYITYVKGNLLFNTLRDTIGESKFMKGLQEYYEDNKFQIATPDNIISAFEKVSNMDLTQFFDSWINGKVDIIEQ